MSEIAEPSRSPEPSGSDGQPRRTRRPPPGLGPEDPPNTVHLGRARSPRSKLSPRQRLVVGWSVLAMAFVLYVVFVGVPYTEDDILLWLTAALFVSCLGNSDRPKMGVLRDWLPFYLVLTFYALLRGYASRVLWGPFVRPQVAFDTVIGDGRVPTVTLQRWLFNPNNLHVWDYAAWIVYMSHFFVSFVVLAILWRRDHVQFRRYMFLFVSLTFVGYVTYVLYPAMPPWLASETHHIAPITRIIPVMWNHVGIHGAAAIFTGGNEFDNNIAAMPSLHAAYPMLLLLFFWRRSGPRIRALLVSYVVAMAFTLVYTGEHFVIDEFVGWSYAAVVYTTGTSMLDRWTANREHLWLIGPLPDPPVLTALSTGSDVVSPR